MMVDKLQWDKPRQNQSNISIINCNNGIPLSPVKNNLLEGLTNSLLLSTTNLPDDPHHRQPTCFGTLSSFKKVINLNCCSNNFITASTCCPTKLTSFMALLSITLTQPVWPSFI